MPTETIEKTRIPGVPDKALVKAASLANTNSADVMRSCFYWG